MNNAKLQRARARWWVRDSADDTDAARRMWAVYERAKIAAQSRISMLASHTMLYGNRAINGFAPGQYDARPADVDEDVLKYNLIRSVIDTVVAKVGKQRPRPIFLTDDGKWIEQQRAKGMTRAVYGEFYRSRFYTTLPKVVRDACIGGTGCMKVYQANDRVTIERVYQWELFVGSADAQYGAPRTLYQRKGIDRGVLRGMFPDHAQAIEDDASGMPDDLRSAYDEDDDRLEVVEAWHLPSAPDADDGRHIIATEGITLLDEPWTRDSFPFAFLHYSSPVVGFFGDSLCDDIKSQQFELNAVLEKTQEAMLLAVPRVYVNRAAKVQLNHMSNVPGEIVEYTGLQPPIHVASEPLSPQYTQHGMTVKNDAYQVAGVSQLSATSQKPTGLNAGVALREFNDIETERFAIFSAAVEEMGLEVARQVIEAIREIVKRAGKYQIQAVDERGRASEMIDWNEVDLDQDSYVMQAYPTALLPTRPAAKLERVLEMKRDGVIDATEAARLLDYPDLDAVTRRKLAPFELVHKAIDVMLRKGVSVTPEPYWPLDYALATLTEAYCRTGLMAEGPEEANRDLVRQCIDLVVELRAIGATPAAPTGAPVPDPMAAPVPNAALPAPAPGLPI